MVCSSMALYSSSPPAAVWSSQCNSHSAPLSTLDADTHLWLQPSQSSSSKQSRGGLSYLFATSSRASSSINETIEAANLSSVGVIRSSSQAEHPSLWDSGDTRPGGISIPGVGFGKARERSSVSFLHSPHSASSSYTCGFSGRDAPGLPPLLRRPCYRSEGSENSYSVVDSALFCGQVESSENFYVHTASPSMFGLELQHRDAVRITETSSDDILADAQRRHRMFLDPLIIKAFRLADEAHRGNYRRTGDPYITHCVDTAILLASAGAEAAVVAAGVLHDTLDDSNMEDAQLRANFGDDVADLVVGVSKISQLSQLARDNNIASKTIEADRLRTMFLAMVDVRVVLVKLADRLHNLRTLHALPCEKQQRIASETLEILVPIANRLGIWSWKAEMEDLCFKYLKPLEYQELSAKIAECCRRGVVISAIEKLEKALRRRRIRFEDLTGRSKNLFSIYSKMMKKGRSIDEIYDMRGLRIIVENEKDCYAALDAVHEIWEHIPGKLKDYIRLPKANGYQSLHTVVYGEDGLPLEVQIRTKEMHRHAEFGMAAHWRYKEGDEKHSAFVLQRVEWARWILTWHSELMDTKLRVSPSQMDLRSSCPFPFHNAGCPHAELAAGPPETDDDPLFVIMLKEQKMLVQELPSGSTAGDLLQQKDAESGMRGLTPRVNHQAVANIEQKLRMGDVVEIVPEALPYEAACKVYVSMARVSSKPDSKSKLESSSSSNNNNNGDKKTNISVYRDQIRRMYGDGSCKADARKSFEIAKSGSSQIAGLT